jgi:3',5'-cyclic AMP phosphodiesterase CpdA
MLGVRPRSFAAGTAAAVLAALMLSSPAARQAAPFFFIQMSDPQFGMFADDKEFAQETINFEMAIATANRLRPAFVVITGDLVNKPLDRAQVDEFERIAGRLDTRIPLYRIAGNHDVENVPTPESVAAYVKRQGRDYYAFRHGPVTGIVLNSSVIHSPSKAPALLDAQRAWLENELAVARQAGARHLIVFQHHPWFLKQADEPDEYFNIPLERRRGYLDLFRRHGVTALVSGHYHRNALGRDGAIEMITTGPVGKPLGEGTQSGFRVFVIDDAGALSHRYYALGELPNRLELPKK